MWPAHDRSSYIPLRPQQKVLRDPLKSAKQPSLPTTMLAEWIMFPVSVAGIVNYPTRNGSGRWSTKIVFSYDLQIRLVGSTNSGGCISTLHRSSAFGVFELLSNYPSCVADNSDLIACTVTSKDTKQRRFLVVDLYQLILVEPDNKRLGWGVVKFAGFLQVGFLCRFVH